MENSLIHFHESFFDLPDTLSHEEAYCYILEKISLQADKYVLTLDGTR